MIYLMLLIFFTILVVIFSIVKDQKREFSGPFKKHSNTFGVGKSVLYFYFKGKEDPLTKEFYGKVISNKKVYFKYAFRFALEWVEKNLLGKNSKILGLEFINLERIVLRNFKHVVDENNIPVIKDPYRSTETITNEFVLYKRKERTVYRDMLDTLRGFDSDLFDFENDLKKVEKLLTSN